MGVELSLLSLSARKPSLIRSHSIELIQPTGYAQYNKGQPQNNLCEDNGKGCQSPEKCLSTCEVPVEFLSALFAQRSGVTNQS